MPRSILPNILLFPGTRVIQFSHPLVLDSALTVRDSPRRTSGLPISIGAQRGYAIPQNSKSIYKFRQHLRTNGGVIGCGITWLPLPPVCTGRAIFGTPAVSEKGSKGRKRGKRQRQREEQGDIPLFSGHTTHCRRPLGPNSRTVPGDGVKRPLRTNLRGFKTRVGNRQNTQFYQRRSPPISKCLLYCD